MVCDGAEGHSSRSTRLTSTHRRRSESMTNLQAFDLAGALGLLIPLGQSTQEQVEGELRLDAQDGQPGARHAQIGEEPGALGEDLSVRRGDVGVGAPDCLDPSVQVPGHGPLLAGGLGVEVHQDHVALLHILPPQDQVGLLEGTVQIGIELQPAHQVDDRDLQALGAVIDPKAPAGYPAGEVGRAEDIPVLLQKVGDLDAVPGVVAQSNHVRPCVVEAAGLSGGDAHHRRVLPVDHGKVDVLRLFQLPQAAGQDILAPLAAHVAYRKYIQQHTMPPWIRFISTLL